MASKENQEALEDVKSNLITDNDYIATITGEAVKTLQQAIDRLELIEKALDKACEYLANVETDGCYYCPYDNDIKKQKCEFNCEDKESIRQFLLSEMEKQ